MIYQANKNDKRPLFKINKKSNRFVALTFLSYAILDDIDRTDLMNAAIKEYINDSNANNRQFDDRLIKV